MIAVMKENVPGSRAGARSYLDWAAAALPDVFAPDQAAASRIFANPSSQHTEGRMAREALEAARSRCAGVLGVSPEKLYFTSGGTESNALMLHSLLRRQGRGRLLYSEIEHPSVRENCLLLGKLGVPVGSIGVEKDGRVTEETLSRALEKHPDTRFIAVMGVNNETGALADIKALVSLLRSHQSKTGGPSIHVHSDLVQALGKLPLDLSAWDLDSASFSAHKLGGPRGLGLLYLKSPLVPLYTGGQQERGIRPGTENTLGVLAFADLLERRANPQTVSAQGEKARTRFKYLIGKLQRCLLVPEDRQEDDPRFSPWIIQLRVRGLPGEVMVRTLDDSGVAVSTGSACSSSSPQRPVLAAMGLDDAARLEGFRVSQGWSTDNADIDALLAGIEKAISLL